MICRACGESNGENACVCSKCGESLRVPGAPAPKKSKKRLLWLLGGAVLAAAVVLCLCFGIRTAKSTASQTLKAVESGDAQKIVQLLPKEAVQNEEGSQQISPEELQNRLDTILQSASVTCSLGEHETVRTDGLGNLIQYYSEYYHCTLDIQKAVSYDVRIIVDGTPLLQTMKVTVLKIDGKWYADLFSLEYLLFVIEDTLDLTTPENVILD